jgi:NAD(P)-dependent dehydrogenase (short-subunit alcohol dehydrogenase family)
MSRAEAQPLEVVTGAGSGIGRAAAVALAARGFAVAAWDIDERSAAETARRILQVGGSATGLRCDVTDEADVVAAYARSLSGTGFRLHAVVANAGVEGPVGTIDECDLDAWNKVVAVNLTGVFLVTKHGIRHFKAAGDGGAIVVTASNGGLAAAPGWAPYAATKGAVQALTRNLAVDHAPDGIRVNCVNPGPIATPLLRRGWSSDGGFDETAERRGHLGRPEEVAAVIAFLASDEASLVSGAGIAADLGQSAHLGVSWPSPSYYN